MRLGGTWARCAVIRAWARTKAALRAKAAAAASMLGDASAWIGAECDAQDASCGTRLEGGPCRAAMDPGDDCPEDVGSGLPPNADFADRSCWTLVSGDFAWGPLRRATCTISGRGELGSLESTLP